MARFNKKDNIALAFDANKKRLRVEGAIILDELMNEAIGEMTNQFDEALNRGEILHVGGSREEMKGFLRIAAQRQLQLGPADESR